ncbi:Choline dehydrogenase [Amycolatopsis pretoriensis]|uniref:Choline dehydrogenase n=1 Tax=Amycolatopsis pretoriensis TaxID=218821 RepID=A0A1H5QNQ2_9PSEU|nr:Choline dehydrogenase [Amycolatopsis pretoriensis]
MSEGPVFVGPGTSRDLPAHVDVLIVGSGPNGATYARVLSEQAPRARILMVDTGPRLTTVPGVHARNIADPVERAEVVAGSEGGRRTASAVIGVHLRQNGPHIVPAAGTFFVDPDRAARNEAGTLPAAALSSNVGGMGRHWAAATPTPHPAELPESVPVGEWSELLATARTLVSTNSAPMTSTGEWAECLRRLGAAFDSRLPPGRKTGDMPIARRVDARGTVVWSGTDTILGTLATEPRDSFAIAADTVCTGLVEERGRITAATLASVLDGSVRTVAATVVIAAADSLRTPQLLWASDIRPDALGRYLGDHIIVSAAITPDYFDRHDDVTAIFEANRSLDDTAGTPSMGLGTIPFDPDHHPMHVQVGQAAIYPRDTGRGKGVVMFGCMLAKDARIEDRVRFSDHGADRYGMPAIEFDYSLTDRDHELIELARRDVGRAAEALGADAAVHPRIQPLGMSLHYLGTTRTGARDDGTSVCDSTSRVWGIDNLYVAGNGVLPAQFSCNPTLASVAMSVRGARAASAKLENSWRKPVTAV